MSRNRSKSRPIGPTSLPTAEAELSAVSSQPSAGQEGVEPFDPYPELDESPLVGGELSGFEPPQPPAPSPQPACRVALEVDLLPAVVTPGYAPRMIDQLILNTTPQRAVMKLLLASLIAQQADLHDGTRVTRNEHALQWLIEQLVIRLPSPTLDALIEGVQ